MRRIGNVTAYFTDRDFPSHFYRCRFSYHGVEFSSMEQFLMFCKAKLFRDEETARKILATDDCREIKALGRQVQGFANEVWVPKRGHFAFVGNREKYVQNPDLAWKLMETFPTILVEASPYDTVWGAGISKTDDRIGDPNQWRGQNLHGETQMRVRTFLFEGGYRP